MSNKYNYSIAEKKWQDFWNENQIYKFDYNSSSPIYSIDTPPPTVSGDIHIGHVFSYTQAEVIVRFQRMQGYNVFYPFGFDNNGLPTEKLVEKEINKKGSELPRKEFVETCLQVTDKYIAKFRELWQSLGISADWSLEYTTISQMSQRISQRSFLELLEKGVATKKTSPALWCTVFQTSVAQAEIDNKETESFFHYLKFKLEDETDVIIATTRPELLPSCVAVFVNPHDERYAHLIGKKIITPFGAKVDILADDKVSIDKGTGVVMCCTYGDDTDIYWVKKHNLPEKIIINFDGKIKNSPIEEMNGLYVKQARTLIVEKLKEQGSLLKSDPITHTVGIGERGGQPIEILPVSQWFIQILPIREKLLELADKINWYPDHMKKRYVEWVENLKWDWGVSRQRFFGVPIPVWYSKKTGEMILPTLDQLPVDPKLDMPKVLPPDHTYDDIEPDKDVLDTWATSSLTPDLNARWKEENSIEDKLLPMTLRPQAHDIIRTWALYTIVKSYLHHDNIPWSNMMISGHVLFKKGEKISKSKNQKMLTPAELIANYSADALRFWACRSSLGKDIQLDEKEIQNGQKLVTKLWNSANFSIMNLSDYDHKNKLSLDQLEMTDRWILSKAQDTAKKMTNYLNNFEFGVAMTEFERFFWHDFCDYYLEMIKNRIYKPEIYENGQAKKLSAQYALYITLNTIIKLIAPYLPHITEEIYQDFFRKDEEYVSIHKAKYPENIIENIENKEQIYKSMDLFFDVVEGVRKFKTESKIRLGEEIELVKISAPSEDLEYLKAYKDDILGVTRAKNIEFVISDSFLSEYFL